MISSSPVKLGKSSKPRVKSPCSPQAVGETEADAEVLLAESVVGTEVELELSRLELEDEDSGCGEVVADEELCVDVELDVREVKLEEGEVAMEEVAV